MSCVGALRRIPSRATLALAGIALLFSLSSRAADAAVFDRTGTQGDIASGTLTGVNRVMFMTAQRDQRAPLPPLADRKYVMAALPDLKRKGAHILGYTSRGRAAAWTMNGPTVIRRRAMGLNADTIALAGTGHPGAAARAPSVFRNEARAESVVMTRPVRPPGPARGDRPRLARGWCGARTATAQRSVLAPSHGRNRVWRGRQRGSQATNCRRARRRGDRGTRRLRLKVPRHPLA